MTTFYRRPSGRGITTAPPKAKPVAPAVVLNSQPSLQERFVNVTADLSLAPVTYGQVQVGGKMFAFDWDETSGTVTTGFIVADGGAAGIDGFVSVLFNGETPPASITINQYLGTQSQTADPLLVAAITDYTDTLAGLAYIVLQMPAGVMDSWPQVVCEIRGLKVYNPKTATTVYSENPALCLGDLIRSSEYGRGTAVDNTALEAAQDACDELVGGEVRRRLCMSLDSAQMVDEWVDILRAYAGCWVDYRGPTAFLIPDRPSASVMSLTAADILKGSLTIKKSDSADIPTVIRVLYSNTAGGEWIEARSDPAQTPGVGSGAVQRRESEINMNGVTRHSQAYREAIERLNKLTLSDLSVRFTMFDAGLRLVLGDVFTITHPLGLTAKLMRIIEAPKQASIGRWQIVAIEYDAAAYSDDVVTEPSAPDTSLPVNAPPAAVTGLAITETTYQLQSGDFPSRLNICFDALQNIYITGYSITVFDGVTPVYNGTAANNVDASGKVCTSTSPLQENVTYTVEVRALSSLYIGTAASGTHLLIGKFALPDAPASIAGFEVGGEVRLSWVKSTDIDARRYWLRYSTPAQTWDDGIDLDQVDALRLNTRSIPEGSFRVWVRTIDSVGGVSTDAAYVDIVVTRDNDAFEAGKLEPMPAGTFTNIAVAKESRASIIQQYYSDSGQSCAAVFGAGSLASKTDTILSYQTMPAAGAVFFFGELDLLIDQSAGWILNFGYTDLSGTAVPQLGTRLNSGAYSFGNLSQQVTARYAKGKLSSSGAFKVTAPQGSLRANVIAREETNTDTTATSGPKKITLSTRYSAVRSISLTPQGVTSVSTAVDNIILNGASGKTEFDIYAFNTTTGAQVSVPVQWQFKGV